MNIVQFDAQRFRSKFPTLSRLYEEAFTTGVYEQFIDIQKELEDDYRTLSEQNGAGFFATIDWKIAGFVLLAPASIGFRMPQELKDKYDMQKALEISKLGIFNEYSRRGIGSELVRRSIEYASENSNKLLFVRTTTTNIPALNLYEKFGFEKSVTVEAEKIKKDRSGKFIEIKQYLIKKLG